MKKTAFLAFFAFFALCAMIFFPLSEQAQRGDTNSRTEKPLKIEPSFVPGEILVQFKANMTEQDAESVLTSINGEVLENIRATGMYEFERGDLVLARFQPDITM